MSLATADCGHHPVPGEPTMPRCSILPHHRATLSSAAALVATLSLLLMAPLAATAQTIVPPGSTVLGKTIGEWTQDWWNWWLSHPAAALPFGDEPLTDPDGSQAHQGQSGPVWFVNGVTGPTVSGAVSRTFSVPSGKYLLLPLINFLFVTSLGELCQDVAPPTEAAIDGVDALFLEINGAEIPEAQLANHREATGCFTAVVPTPDNPALEPVGSWPGSYGTGYWVMLEPLPAGQHTIHGIGTHSGFQINIDVTDVITTAPMVPSLRGWSLGLLLATLCAAAALTLRIARRT